MRSRAVASSMGLATLAFAWSAGAQVSSVGLSAVRAQWIENEGVGAFEPEAGDRYGAAFATGDFDDDGFEDLATGIPGDDGLGGLCTDCGAVVVRYGALREGLETDVAPIFLSPELAGMPGQALHHEQYGAALAAGDFNGDGADDLAVGVPVNTEDPGFPTGAVMVHYGHPGSGLDLLAAHILRPGRSGIPGRDDTVEFQDFGASLAVGDFDGSGVDDLAVGAPFGVVEKDVLVGTVTVFHGRGSGLLPFAGSFIHQGTPFIPDQGETFDRFSAALAAGNFNGDAFDDLAIGVPGEDDVGFVLTLFGHSTGLIFFPNLWYRQEDIGFGGGVGEPGDRFGDALAAGDFDDDHFDDLAIGTPYENLCSACLRGDAVDSGQINVLYGTAALEFDLTRTQFFDQGFEGNETGDLFGWSLAAGDFNGDDLDDLGIGHLEEDNAAGSAAGAVTVILGNRSSPPGLCCRVRTIVQGEDGFPGGAAQDVRYFGSALAAGDFDGDGNADLAVGAPREDVDGLIDVGIEMVLYGSLFADGFGTEDASHWTLQAP